MRRQAMPRNNLDKLGNLKNTVKTTKLKDS